MQRRDFVKSSALAAGAIALAKPSVSGAAPHGRISGPAPETPAVDPATRDLLLEALQDEWPDAQVAIEDDEDERAEIDGPSGRFLQDVEDRVNDIVDELLEDGAWRDEEEELFGDEEESERDDSEEF